MGYTIVYDKRFIKTKHGIIPLLLAGSSNCYKINHQGKEIKERSWQCFTYIKRPMSAEDIMEKIESMVPSSYGEHFVCNGKWVDDVGFVNFYKSGIKNAMTLEELKEKYRMSRLYVSLCIKDTSSFIGYTSIDAKYFTENNELDDWLGCMFEQISNLPPDSFSFFEYRIEVDWQAGADTRLQPRIKNRRKVEKTRESGFLLEFEDGSFFQKRSSAHMWRTHLTSKARHFSSVKEADEYWKNKLCSYKIATAVTIVVKKVIVVRTKTNEEIEYWTGTSFVANRAQAEEFSSQAAANGRINSSRFSRYVNDTDVCIKTDVTQVMTLKREVVR